MTTIQVGHARITVRETGSGTPVVLLHGSAGNGGQWRGVTDALTDRLGDGRFQFQMPDLHGYGRSEPWPGHSPMKLCDEAAVVWALIRRLGRPVHLVGHSYGGAAALIAALHASRDIRSLTLIEPVAFHLLRGGDRQDRILFQEAMALADGIDRGLATGGAWVALERFVDFWNGTGTWARLSREVKADAVRRMGAIALNFWATTTERMPLDLIAGLRTPTLLITGGQSPRIGQRIPEILAAALPVATSYRIRKAGHMLPVTHPVETAAVLAGHLARWEAPAFGGVDRRAA